MQTGKIVAAVVSGVVVAGCTQDDTGFVDFRTTTPSQLDVQPLPKPDVTPVLPVSTASADAPSPTAVDPAMSGTTADARQADLKQPAAQTMAPAAERVVVSKQSGLTGPADVPVIDNAASGEVRKIELLIPQKHFRKERGTSAVRVTYDDIDLLKVLNMEPVPVDAASHFPEWLKALDGKPVRIRGFMFPTFEATGLSSFVLARDNGICCFVRKPKIYDIISVVMADGQTTDYIENRPFDVEGIFHIQPNADATELAGLYHIRDARVLTN